MPVDRIRREFGVGWNTVMQAVIAAAEQLAPVQAGRVGIEETVMTTGRLTRRRRQFLTALVCLETSLVIAVTQGRDRASATRLLADHTPDATVVALDLFSGYKTAADALEDAVVVADVFHLLRLTLQALDVSHVTVTRLWKRWQLQPWRVETYRFSTDPELVAKVTDIVGLTLHPPENAIVLCVDLEVADPGLGRHPADPAAEGRTGGEAVA